MKNLSSTLPCYHILPLPDLLRISPADRGIGFFLFYRVDAGCSQLGKILFRLPGIFLKNNQIHAFFNQRFLSQICGYDFFRTAFNHFSLCQRQCVCQFQMNFARQFPQNVPLCQRIILCVFRFPKLICCDISNAAGFAIVILIEIKTDFYFNISGPFSDTAFQSAVRGTAGHFCMTYRLEPLFFQT